MSKRETAKVVIVGTGFSGLGMAIALKKDGQHDFVILEKATDIGGTWRDNTYPGCACDVQSHMYSFSFEQNPEWSRSFSPQQEIWDYMRRVVDKYDLRRHIRFGVEMTGARWDESAGQWQVETTSGAEFIGQFLVSGVGALHIPKTPELPGLSEFSGPVFHSANWDHDVDLRGKRVAVIGTGASSIQFVPQIAPDVRELHLFQRTPSWIMPKPDHEIPERMKRMFRSVPGAQRVYRNLLYWFLESRAIGFNGHPKLQKLGEQVAKRHLAKQVPDRAMRRALTPDYTMGCKRVLISNDFYPALNRDNVELVTTGIREVRPNGVVSADGTEREVDAIILGTGFHVTDAFDYLDITGLDGRKLTKQWQQEGMQTHLGINVAGFPNLFFLLGPNTGLGHNSVVFMIEAQIRYVAQALRLVERHRAQALDVRERVQAGFNEEIQHKLIKGVWSQGGCTSWYLDAMGVNRTVWPGFTWRYWQRTRRINAADFELLGAA
ncbi:cation diffusion facilitator CzcD-associated flavoprotein CzcO [Tamaricihabitans halophyticus]|uniref:Cation diffusion facilitator CzcD-associated flavoprotein CzcO n=1 Tax=Tamaricihabitans halophyticus TaxID=1262583 RepID=A0A4R2QIL9_9PSEU|nr:NAD(P)/FAD-dependent oxidoreductase [Tamaricihabitans halophyticus]TCP46795.1 cation diffusion facilitator CzcD-associated flavoprotein CzcO [Tamaricihabitans halophyticus]